MYAIPFFFGSAAIGFVMMAAVGVQAAMALFSSIPLARRKRAENPAFNIKRAYVRVTQVAGLTLLLCIVVSALIIHFGSPAVIWGYGLGFILAFIMDLKRMSPNNAQNQRNFEDAYADCAPSSDNPDDAASTPEVPAAAAESPGDNPERAAKADGSEEASDKS